jgi:transposase
LWNQLKGLLLGMETKNLYAELLNLPSLEITNVSIETKCIVIQCHPKKDVTESACPNCQCHCHSVNQITKRTIRDLDISGREVWLEISVRQWICKKCNRYFTEMLEIADLGKSYTYRMSKWIYLLCRKQNYTETGALLNIHSKTVERIVLYECEKNANVALRYSQVRRLGIDEQSHRKGKKNYFCVLTDLDRGIVLDLLEERTYETLAAHFQLLGSDFCAQITDISCDNWDAYLKIANVFFPNAQVILDRFHVTKSLNEGLDTYRKTLSKDDVPELRQLKWVLYKQFQNLSDKQLDTFNAAVLKVPRLGVLYFKREEFHHIMDHSDSVEEAMESVQKWIDSLPKEGISEFDKFVKMFLSKKEFILNYVTNHLSNAVTEGLNNLIRYIKRFSFGMPHFQNLRWRVLDISS